MFCSLDKIDLVATVAGEPVAVQTDHRTAREIEATPELSVNARAHVEAEGHAGAAVHYVVADEPGFLDRLLRRK